MNGSALALLANSNSITQGVYEVCKPHIQISSVDQPRNIYPVSDSAFDEEFDVRDEETVKTPRSCSPSVEELIRKLPAMNPNKLSRSAIPYGYPRFESSMRFRSLAELACKPSPYPLDKLYDESIPVRPAVRSINEPPRMVSNTADKPRLTKGSLTRHQSVRLLESIQPRPLSQIPMRSMSSAGLIGDFTGLSFQLDTLPITDGFLSIPSSKFLDIDQSFPNSLEKSTKHDAETNVTDCENQSNGHQDNNASKEDHDFQVSTTQDSEIPPDVSLNLMDNTIENQSSTLISKTSTSKLLDKTKMSRSSVRERTSSTKKTKLVSSNSTGQAVWSNVSLSSSDKFPTSNNQENNMNSDQGLVINIENCSSDDSAPHTYNDKMESHSNDSGNHSISSNSDINLPLKPETTTRTSTIPTTMATNTTTATRDHISLNDCHTNQETYVLDAAVDRFDEDTQIADEEFTLVTNKKMRKKQRYQAETHKALDKPPQLPSRLPANDRLKHLTKPTISTSPFYSVPNHHVVSAPGPRISSNRLTHKPHPNSISFSTDQPKNPRSSRGKATNHESSSVPSTPSHTSSSSTTPVSSTQAIPKLNGLKNDLTRFRKDSKTKDTSPNYKKSLQPGSKTNTKLSNPSNPSSYLNQVTTKPSAPFCIDRTQHRLLVQFLISSWKSFQSNIRPY